MCAFRLLTARRGARFWDDGRVRKGAQPVQFIRQRLVTRPPVFNRRVGLDNQACLVCAERMQQLPGRDVVHVGNSSMVDLNHPGFWMDT